jgi:uncharacterized protein (TIGR01319 family)
VVTDVLDGVRHALRELGAHGAPVPDLTDHDRVLVCSSAGGGLRIAVVGYERLVTAEAGHRVGLSAGGKVVHVASGPLDGPALQALRASRPDVVLLVGGTDGGNAEVLVHNARRLARARLAVPVVVAGNRDAQEEVAALLASTGRRFVLADNVLPRIGVVQPHSARAAIREMFLRHVIGGKGLSRGPLFASLVRAPTPDAVLSGVQVLADAAGEDVMVVDVGGATTDVYSALTPEGEDASLRKDVVATLWQARTVEGDLGMRWSARGVLEAVAAERLEPDDPEGLAAWVDRVSEDPQLLPQTPEEHRHELRLAGLAALVACRRHARPPGPGESPRPLVNVRHLVGSGGVLRHAGPADAEEILGAVLRDHGGGWRPPAEAGVAVDTAYLLFAAGLLARDHPDTARAVARRVLDPAPADAERPRRAAALRSGS